MVKETEESPVPMSENGPEQESSNLTAEAKLLKATEYKLEGNVFFKQKDFKKAIRNYHR